MSGAMWVFGYGSLIWDPGFPVAERQVARLDGWHRSFCMWSVHYRGTPQVRGLVLALDRKAGGVCHGVAFRVEPGAETDSLAALRARELISDAYVETHVAVGLADGSRQNAVTYVINPQHAQYAAGLSLQDQVAIIATSQGVRGPNRDYLYATARHLAELGIADPDLDRLATLVAEMPQ
jgi:glutathione-specific gamma-glutamylcyclotransferase